MATSVRTPDQAAASGAGRAARAGYRWLLLAFLLAVAAQIFLAGLGVFSFGAGEAAGGRQIRRPGSAPRTAWAWCSCCCWSRRWFLWCSGTGAATSGCASR
jgi:hypothetical protein